jgi:isopentenyl phosphate kinase
VTSDFYLVVNELIQVVKLGGSILTYANRKPGILEDLLDSPEHYLRGEKEIRRYAKEILEAWKDRPGKHALVLSHGVKQYGHDVTRILGVTPEVRKYCNFLNDIIVETFRKQGLPIERVDLARTCKWNAEIDLFEIPEFLRQTNKIIEAGGLPLSWGTVVDAIPSGYKIMSGDDAVLWAGLVLRANEVIMYLDVSVSDKNPSVHSDAKPLRYLCSSEDLCVVVDKRDRTGGLKAKLKKMEILALSGSVCQIVNGIKRGSIYQSLMGEEIGTIIRRGDVNKSAYDAITRPREC